MTTKTDTSFFIDRLYIQISRLLQRTAAAIVGMLQQRHKAHRRRQQLTLLLKYDDHILEDMGYTREVILSAVHLPLSRNVDHFLRYWTEQSKLPKRRR